MHPLHPALHPYTMYSYALICTHKTALVVWVALHVLLFCAVLHELHCIGLHCIGCMG